MKPRLRAFGIAVLIFTCALLPTRAQFGQQRPGIPGRGAATPQMPAPSDIPTPTDNSTPIKAESIVVPVRVVVRDSEGHVVSTLHKEDFKLFDDGKQQQITGFLLETNVAVSRPVVMLGNYASPAAAPANAPSAVTLPSHFVGMFFDDADLSNEDLIRSRNAASKFLDTSLQPDERVGILTVSGQSQLDFTEDRDKLHATLLKLMTHPATAGVTSNALSCPPMDFFEADAIANQHDPTALGIATRDALSCAFNDEPQFRKQAQDMASRSAEDAMRQADIQTEAVLRRLREIVRRVAVLPGEKSILMISPGFIYPTHENELADIMESAIHSSVRVNTLDARGLYAPDMGDISQPQLRAPNGGEGILMSYRLAGQSTQSSVLAELADATGGIAFHDNNDLAAGFRQAAASPESYYLLSFSPKNLKADGKYHKLKVSFAGNQNYSIDFRHGFYAPHGIETADAAVKREIDDVVFSQDEIHGVPIKLLGGSAKADNGKSTLEIVAVLDVNQITFQKAGPLNEDKVTVVTSIFDGDGNYVTGTENNYDMKLHDENLAELKKNGFPVDTKFDIRSGTYLVRVVLRDANAAMFSATTSAISIPQ